jgi:hypothetical protein
MIINEAREKAKEIFEPWFKIFHQEGEKENKERLFEIFYSGYLAGTKFTPGERPIRISNIMMDDVNKNLDL